MTNPTNPRQVTKQCRVKRGRVGHIFASYLLVLITFLEDLFGYEIDLLNLSILAKKNIYDTSSESIAFLQGWKYSRI